MSSVRYGPYSPPAAAAEPRFSGEMCGVYQNKSELNEKKSLRQCHCHVQPVSRAGHHLGIATRSPHPPKPPGHISSSPSWSWHVS